MTDRDTNILVVGHTDSAAGEAMQLSRFSDRLTLLTDSHTNEISSTYERRLADERPRRLRRQRRHADPLPRGDHAVHEGAQAAPAANYYLYPPELRGD